MPRDAVTAIDFHQVETHQRGIDARLANWACWCHGPAANRISPMFRLYRSSNARGECHVSEGIDSLDAARIAKGVAALPAPHRIAISWCYIVRTAPRRACQQLGVSMEGLAVYIRDGRQMLINREV